MLLLRDPKAYVIFFYQIAMNRKVYFDYIEERLSTLATRIAYRGKLNILDLHIYSENFYRDCLNKLYDFKLENLNAIEQNAESIDLISHEMKIIIQVSATCTKEKIESALEKEVMNTHKDYTFYFISICKDASDLRKKTYKNKHGIIFDPKKHIYDVPTLLNSINDLEIDPCKMMYEFIKKELGNSEVDPVKLDSNLTSIVNILSKEDLGGDNQVITLNTFEIDRKISYNELDIARSIINDYAIYHNKLDKIYSEFDLAGINKSTSVLGAVRKEYNRNKTTMKADDLFFLVVKNVQEVVVNSKNFTSMPIDELELCINIIVVDAFIRCKIFENPNNYNYVTTG